MKANKRLWMLPGSGFACQGKANLAVASYLSLFTLLGVTFFWLEQPSWFLFSIWLGFGALSSILFLWEPDCILRNMECSWSQIVPTGDIKTVSILP